MNSILDDFKLAFKTGNILNQLIVINVVVFVMFGLLRLFFDFGQSTETYQEIESFFSLPSNVGKLLYRPWSLITHMFMHAGVSHIFWNMLFMYWFGKIITEYIGQNKLLGLYVWGGFGGALTFVLSYNLIPLFGNEVNVSEALGASAAVNAIVVGAATFLPDYRVRLIFIGLVKLKYIAAFFVVSSLLNTTGINAGGEFAHLGGALIGYLSMKQLQGGSDWSIPVVQFITWVKSLFKPQPKIKVSYRSAKSSSSAKSTNSTRTSEKKKPETSQSEIDAILDKISERGYDALTKEEKQKLFNASKD